MLDISRGRFHDDYGYDDDGLDISAAELVQKMKLQVRAQSDSA